MGKPGRTARSCAASPPGGCGPAGRPQPPPIHPGHRPVRWLPAPDSAAPPVPARPSRGKNAPLHDSEFVTVAAGKGSPDRVSRRRWSFPFRPPAGPPRPAARPAADYAPRHGPGSPAPELTASQGTGRSERLQPSRTSRPRGGPRLTMGCRGRGPQAHRPGLPLPGTRPWGGPAPLGPGYPGDKRGTVWSWFRPQRLAGHPPPPRGTAQVAHGSLRDHSTSAATTDVRQNGQRSSTKAGAKTDTGPGQHRQVPRFSGSPRA